MEMGKYNLHALRSVLAEFSNRNTFDLLAKLTILLVSHNCDSLWRFYKCTNNDGNGVGLCFNIGLWKHISDNITLKF